MVNSCHDFRNGYYFWPLETVDDGICTSWQAHIGGNIFFLILENGKENVINRFVGFFIGLIELSTCSTTVAE